MNAQFIVLGFLSLKSMTGYEIKKKFSFSFAFFSGLSFGSIYPALKKLEDKGFISMRMEIQDGAPNRKIYTITERGRKEFLKQLRSPMQLEKGKSIFLTRLFFFAHLSPEEQSGIASTYLEAIRETQGMLQKAEPLIESHADQFQLLCFNFGQRFFNDLARNVTRTIEEMKTFTENSPIPCNEEK